MKLKHVPAFTLTLKGHHEKAMPNPRGSEPQARPGAASHVDGQGLAGAGRGGQGSLSVWVSLPCLTKVLRVDWRWNCSPCRQNPSTTINVPAEAPPPHRTTNVHELRRNFPIFQVINYLNKTLRQYSKLKLNQEKIGLFVLERCLKLSD